MQVIYAFVVLLWRFLQVIQSATVLLVFVRLTAKQKIKYFIGNRPLLFSIAEAIAFFRIYFLHFLILAHTGCICGRTKYINIVLTSNGKQDATADHGLHQTTLASKDPVSLRALSSEQRYVVGGVKAYSKSKILLYFDCLVLKGILWRLLKGLVTEHNLKKNSFGHVISSLKIVKFVYCWIILSD